MRLLKVFLSVSFLMFSLTFCGSEDNNDSNDDATVASSVGNAVNSTQGEITAGAKTKTERATEFDYKDLHFTVKSDNEMEYSGIVQGPAGGSAEVSGTISINDTKTELSFDMKFSGYKDNQNVVLDGTVSCSVLVDEGTVKISYNGDVTASGSVSGSFKMDLTMEIGENGVKIEGNINGHPLSFDSSKTGTMDDLPDNYTDGYTDYTGM